MSYRVKTIYKTIQGEGAQAGRASVFLRFTGCNLWTGREEDRARAVCQFCDTQFLGTDGPGGGVFAEAAALARAVAEVARTAPLPIERPAFHRAAIHHGINPAALADDVPMVVCTGGEPTLQLDEALVDALHAEGLQVAIETNGTRLTPAGVDWICVSPKAGAPLVQTTGHELKLVFPQPALPPDALEHLEFDNYFLQPMDGPHAAENTRAALAYCLENPRWRLSIQLHKILGID